MKHKLEYYFIDDTSNYEYEVKNKGQINNLNIGVWESQLGMDYRIFDNWLVSGEINYLQSFKNQPFGFSRVWQFGGRVGVKYEF